MLCATTNHLSRDNVARGVASCRRGQSLLDGDVDAQSWFDVRDDGDGGEDGSGDTIMSGKSSCSVDGDVAQLGTDSGRSRRGGAAVNVTAGTGTAHGSQTQTNPPACRTVAAAFVLLVAVMRNAESTVDSGVDGGEEGKTLSSTAS